MTLVEFEGKRPRVHPDAFVAPTAVLIGDVTVEAGASVWYGAVLRADICTIVVREGSNIQDGSVLHAAPGEVLEVGPNATVGHGCVVHGRAVEEKALVGNGSTLLDGSVVGPGTLVAAGSVVTPGTVLPGGMVAAGIPCRPTKPVGGTSSELWVETNAAYYRELAERHAAGAVVVEPDEPDEPSADRS
ncbi:gamma carbonic anhydrase family protein [Nocardioides litoris]|uniref:gamma carbonic anhydrase family protein n=1 Tax=Nocardioides litoris TaxID=1926648 RepID=UPI0011220AEA|nr:gamma carbonic anhydrase family protein [Nocardioides litoris]